MTLLITGATGPIGRSLVRQLVEAGADVRVTTRDRSKVPFDGSVDVVEGDFTAGGLPPSAFDGVTKAFVFPAPTGINPFLAQAADSRIEEYVLLSSLAAAGEHERDHGSISNVHHSAIEKCVLDTGVPTTIIRPGDFANNLLFWAWTIKTNGAVFGPYPTSSQAPIHEADVAAVAATALIHDGHAGNTYALTGPESLTRSDQLATIGSAIGRDLVFHEVSPDQFAEQMSEYMPTGVIDMLLAYWSDTVSEPDRVLDTVELVTGRPAHTLARWAEDHVDDFR
jgi:uncharacterized protein YbjT (DUF2867 family)